jgi:8-oxo-dGTP pyrophosphatase MutT (NUDIX family)
MTAADSEQSSAAGGGAVAPRPASSVILLRDGELGPEVFMVERQRSAKFVGGAHVFPGGRVDAEDAEAEDLCIGLDDAAASQRLAVERGGLAHYVAAIRECFEEAGVLLARHADDEQLVRFDDPEVAERFNTARHAIHAGEGTLAQLCVLEDLQLLPGRMHFVSHWLTPIGERRRFDTRFFIAEAPRSQAPLHDDQETIDSLWIRPADALAKEQARELRMMPPTIASLRMLAEHGSVADVVASVEAAGVPSRIEPRVVLDDTGRLVGITIPGDDGFETTPIPEYVIGNPR